METAMRVASTVRFESVEIIGESDLGLCCRIAGRDHWIVSDRLLDGSSIAHFGDRGVLVIARQLAEECGLLLGRSHPLR
jgi:hypothetical protein